MKNSFFKSSIILIIGGFITKLLGMLIKIIINRLISIEGVSLYTIIIPTYMLLITICQMGLPIAISKIVSEGNKSKKLLLSIIPTSILLNIIIMVIFIYISPFIANTLLQNKDTIIPLKAMSLTLPFIAISSTLRGYFLGKEKMHIHVISNIIEDIIKIILLIIGIPIIKKYGTIPTISFVILTNIASEISSIIIFIICMPKSKINVKDLIPNKKYIKEVLGISIPTTTSRLIGNFAFFLEPIIITYFLTKNGYTNNYITKEYGIINGYVMPLLMLPSFFTSAISSALIPVVSKAYKHNNINLTKKRIKESIIFSILIGIPSTLIFILIPQIPLKLIYNTTNGIKYIRILSLICFLYYLESPIISALQAMGYSKKTLIGTIIGVSIKLLSLIILTNMKIGLWSLIISTSLNIISVTLYDYILLRKIVCK